MLLLSIFSYIKDLLFYHRGRPQQPANFSQRIGETEDDSLMMEHAATTVPILDQHIAIIKENSRWWMPAAGGILAIAMRFYDPLSEYLGLVTGLGSNLFQSISGEKGV